MKVGDFMNKNLCNENNKTLSPLIFRKLWYEEENIKFAIYLY